MNIDLKINFYGYCDFPYAFKKCDTTVGFPCVKNDYLLSIKILPW